MTNPGKNVDQAQAYRGLPAFAAGPLAGQGRWAHVDDNLVLYTDDHNILFVRGTSPDLGEWAVEIVAAHDVGETATEAFDRLRGDASAVSGDLANLV